MQVGENEDVVNDCGEGDEKKGWLLERLKKEGRMEKKRLYRREGEKGGVGDTTGS
jgi:hypothetical protein